LEIQARLMADIAVDIIEQWKCGELSSKPQQEEMATLIFGGMTQIMKLMVK